MPTGTPASAQTTAYTSSATSPTTAARPRRSYLSRLNGHLHLIRGNHDTGLNHAKRLLDYCDSVTDFLEIDDGGTHILLCHYPILHEKGGYMIHGHIHNQRNHAYEILKTLPRVLNAGVDINFYRPVLLDELVENNRKYYSEEYPELFPVPPRPTAAHPASCRASRTSARPRRGIDMRERHADPQISVHHRRPCNAPRFVIARRPVGRRGNLTQQPTDSPRLPCYRTGPCKIATSLRSSQ